MIVASVNDVEDDDSVRHADPLRVTVIDEIGLLVVEVVVKFTVIDPPPTAGVAEVMVTGAGAPSGVRVVDDTEWTDSPPEP